jgi:hypothetical protein
MLLKKHAIKYQFRQIKWFNISKATDVYFGYYVNYNLKKNRYESYATSITDKILKKFPNLMKLDLRSSESYKLIKKNSSIYNLKNLKCVKISSYESDELLKKINLNNLEILKICGKFINVDTLYNLKHLSIVMNVMSNNIDKILVKTPNLVSLTLHNPHIFDCGITDNDIVNLHSLRHLNILGDYAFNGITGEFIRKCPNLNTLFLITRRFIDPNMFSAFKGDSLAIYSNMITDEILMKLNKLKKLFICVVNWQITDESIKKLSDLEILMIDRKYNNITHESLTKLPKLKYIFCDYSQYNNYVKYLPKCKIISAYNNIIPENHVIQTHFFVDGDVYYSEFY